jgi:hypothetical protein
LALWSRFHQGVEARLSCLLRVVLRTCNELPFGGCSFPTNHDGWWRRLNYNVGVPFQPSAFFEADSGLNCGFMSGFESAREKEVPRVHSHLFDMPIRYEFIACV